MKLPTILAIALATAVFQAGANTHADVQLSLLQPATADAIWSREKQVTPMYPIELAQQGIAGCGVFNVTINEHGKTTDVSLVNSVPGKVIARPAIKPTPIFKDNMLTQMANMPMTLAYSQRIEVS